MIVGEVPRAGQPIVGGPENGTARLVRGLAERGTRVTVVAPAAHGEAATADRVDGVDVVFVRHDTRLSLLRGMRPWRAAALRAVEAAHGDVVHGQGVLVGGIVAAAASGPRLVTVRGNARRDTLAAYPGLSGRARGVLREQLVEHVVDRVDLFVGVHPDWRINLPVAPRRFEYVPNVVDEVFFAVERTAPSPTVLFCGGPRRIKGWDLLEIAFEDVRRAVPDARVDAYGWPSGIAPPTTPGARIHPAADPEALASAMASAAVLVIPSRYDVSPILLAEAWAAGIPVVATSAGGLSSLAPGGAVVVPPESPAALTDAIVGVLRGETDTSENVATGRERAARHRGHAVIGAHLALYEALGAGRR